MKSQGERITVAGFARRNGYANKSALRHFKILRRELSEYVAQFSPNPRSREDSLKVKFLESQNERQSREIERLKKQVKTIPGLKEKIAILDSGRKDDAKQNKLLRGMLSTVISFISNSDFAMARKLSARLEELAKDLIEGEDQESSD